MKSATALLQWLHPFSDSFLVMQTGLPVCLEAAPFVSVSQPGLANDDRAIWPLVQPFLNCTTASLSVIGAICKCGDAVAAILITYTSALIQGSCWNFEVASLLDSDSVATGLREMLGHTTKHVVGNGKIIFASRHLLRPGTIGL